MSLKDVFKQKKIGHLSTTTQDEILIVETRQSVEEILKEKNEVIPLIDFSLPENFAKFGSAELYYKDSIENIYKNYPYDGSKKDKQEFYNDLALYEKHIFDYEYPKSTGYIHLISSSYIAVNLTSSQKITEDRENELKLSSTLSSQFQMGPDGNTIEFWLKEGPTEDGNYYLLDISGKTESNKATRIFCYTSAVNGLFFSYYKYNVGATINVLSLSEWNVLKNNWHHYSFTIYSDGVNTNLLFMIDGNDEKSANKYKKNFIISNSVLDIEPIKEQKITIGRQVSTSAYSVKDVYLDEFKIWNKAKDERWINQTWFYPINGCGKNTTINNDLYLYYKFNEGIISSSSINDYDKVVLDYSGYFRNGQIINYNLYNKSTSSAIDESGFFSFQEEKDPIVFSKNPLIQNFLYEKQKLGKKYDLDNTSQFFNLFPNWVRDEDEVKNGELRNITQTISSYLDKLYLQIDYINKIKYSDYESYKQKSLPFAKNLLGSKSIFIDDIFADATIIEELFSRNENGVFEEKFNNIKNSIYKNIYNNLSYIYKSKGTEKSYRNLFRSFGIDDELIKFNLYANNAELDISKSKKIQTTLKKNVIDFSQADNQTACVFQAPHNGYPSVIYSLNGGRDIYLPQTLECQVIFPHLESTSAPSSRNMRQAMYLSSSIFGVHSTIYNNEDTTWKPFDPYNFQVYAVKPYFGSTGVNFVLKSNGFGSNITLKSPFYSDVYENTKWNFAVRIKPNIDDYMYFQDNRPIDYYDLEFYGVQTDANVILNEFTVSTKLNTLATQNAIDGFKKIYLGAHRDNFTGSLLQRSDMKIVNARYWINYLNDDIIKSHAYNPNVYGGNNSTKKAFNGFINSSSYAKEFINEIDTLILNWDFSTISGSDNNGSFIVNHIETSPTPENILAEMKTYYYGKGYGFQQNDKKVVSTEFLNISKEQLPEYLDISNTVNIGDSNNVFTQKNGILPEVYMAIEKSMYSIISEEMMNMFSSINDFNNLLANPLNTYKKDYKEMSFLRRIFFNKVNNVPNFERYLSLYKWIDESIGIIIKQLSPATSDVPDTIATIIESHLLERNKYERKLSVFREAQKLNSYPIKGIRELLYSPKKDINWLKERVERNDSLVTSGDIIIDNIRQKILNSLINDNSQNDYNLRDNNGNIYQGSNYILKRLSIPYRITRQFSGLETKNRLIHKLQELQKIASRTRLDTRIDPRIKPQSHRRIKK